MPVFKGRLQVYRVCRHGNYLEKKQAILYPSEPQVLRVADNEAWVVQMLFVVVKSLELPWEVYALKKVKLPSLSDKETETARIVSLFTMSK